MSNRRHLCRGFNRNPHAAPGEDFSATMRAQPKDAWLCTACETNAARAASSSVSAAARQQQAQHHYHQAPSTTTTTHQAHQQQQQPTPVRYQQETPVRYQDPHQQTAAYNRYNNQGAAPAAAASATGGGDAEEPDFSCAEPLPHGDLTGWKAPQFHPTYTLAIGAQQGTQVPVDKRCNKSAFNHPRAILELNNSLRDLARNSDKDSEFATAALARIGGASGGPGSSAIELTAELKHFWHRVRHCDDLWAIELLQFNLAERRWYRVCSGVTVNRGTFRSTNIYFTTLRHVVPDEIRAAFQRWLAPSDDFVNLKFAIEGAAEDNNDAWWVTADGPLVSQLGGHLLVRRIGGPQQQQQDSTTISAVNPNADLSLRRNLRIPPSAAPHTFVIAPENSNNSNRSGFDPTALFTQATLQPDRSRRPPAPSDSSCICTFTPPPTSQSGRRRASSSAPPKLFLLCGYIRSNNSNNQENDEIFDDEVGWSHQYVFLNASRAIEVCQASKLVEDSVLWPKLVQLGYFLPVKWNIIRFLAAKRSDLVINECNEAFKSKDVRAAVAAVLTDDSWSQAVKKIKKAAERAQLEFLVGDRGSLTDDGIILRLLTRRYVDNKKTRSSFPDFLSHVFKSVERSGVIPEACWRVEDDSDRKYNKFHQMYHDLAANSDVDESEWSEIMLHPTLEEMRNGTEAFAKSHRPMTLDDFRVSGSDKLDGDEIGGVRFLLHHPVMCEATGKKLTASGNSVSGDHWNCCRPRHLNLGPQGWNTSIHKGMGDKVVARAIQNNSGVMEEDDETRVKEVLAALDELLEE